MEERKKKAVKWKEKKGGCKEGGCKEGGVKVFVLYVDPPSEGQIGLRQMKGKRHEERLREGERELHKVKRNH